MINYKELCLITSEDCSCLADGISCWSIISSHLDKPQSFMIMLLATSSAPDLDNKYFQECKDFKKNVLNLCLVSAFTF